MPPVALRMMKEFVIRFGDLPTDQAWHVQNMMNNLLIQTTMDGEEGRKACSTKSARLISLVRCGSSGEPWEEPEGDDAERRWTRAYRSGREF